MTKTNSITFNQNRLDTLNVGWRTTERPTSPSKKVSEYSPLAFDGSYDFSTFNPDGRPHYEQGQISGEIMIVSEKDLSATQRKLTQVMQFLHSAQGQQADFVFDDSPDRIYRVRFLDSSSITGYEMGKNITLTVTFTCEPFPYSKQEVLSKTVSGYDTIECPLGSWYARPLIEIRGAGGDGCSIIAPHTGRRLDYSGDSGILLFDFATESVYANGQSVNHLVTGDFWELTPFEPDGNKLGISCPNGQATVKVMYRVYEVY